MLFQSFNTWRCSKRGLYKFFGLILGFYTKNSPRNSWSPNFRITIWYQKSRNVGTSCIHQKRQQVLQGKIELSELHGYYCQNIFMILSQDSTYNVSLKFNCVHTSWSRGMNIYWQRCAWECSPNCPHKSFRNSGWLTVNSYSLAFLQEWILYQKHAVFYDEIFWLLNITGWWNRSWP